MPNVLCSSAVMQVKVAKRQKPGVKGKICVMKGTQFIVCLFIVVHHSGIARDSAGEQATSGDVHGCGVGR